LRAFERIHIICSIPLTLVVIVNLAGVKAYIALLSLLVTRQCFMNNYSGLSRYFLHPHHATMCGDSNRPTFGGTIAVLFPRENKFYSNSSEASLSSSPESVASSASTSSMSSYSLFFRDPETAGHKTKAIFQIDDAQTYHALRGCRQVNMRIE
jgi:hypothetical protein